MTLEPLVSFDDGSPLDADHARYTAHYWSGGQPCESAYTVVYEVEMTRMG